MKGNVVYQHLSSGSTRSVASARIVTLFIAVVFTSSCSVYIAANQPEEKGFEVLTEGTPQSLVRTELGPPVWSGKDDRGCEVDVFHFVQGYSHGSKTARAVWHGVADLFTGGLWEVIGTPAEAIASGTKIKATVTYDEGQRVETVTLHDDKGNEIPLQKKA